MTEARKIRVGVIGAGGIAGVHFKSLAQLAGAELAGICDIAPGKAEAAAKQHGGRAYTDFLEMLDREKLELVLLLTPPAVRLDPIRACAEREIAMFIEKPPARSVAEAREAVALIRQHNLVNSVGFVLRYRELVRRVRALLEGRRIHLIRMRYYAPMILQYEKFPPFYFLNEVSGGMLVDQALHFIDLARYLVGDEIAEVHGVGSNLFRPRSKEITTPENVVLDLRFANGAVGSHTHTWAFESWTGEIELVSPRARLVFDVFNSKLTGVVDGQAVEEAESDAAFVSELRAVIDAVRTGDRSPILSTYEDAVKTLAVCVAANRSIESHATERVESV